MFGAVNGFGVAAHGGRVLMEELCGSTAVGAGAAIAACGLAPIGAS
jgi:hypothetical protein